MTLGGTPRRLASRSFAAPMRRESISWNFDSRTRWYRNPANPPTTASSTAAYHACTRQRSDLRIDDVPQSAPGGDEVLTQFFPDVGDVNLHQVGQGIVGFV